MFFYQYISYNRLKRRGHVPHVSNIYRNADEVRATLLVRRLSCGDYMKATILKLLVVCIAFMLLVIILMSLSLLFAGSKEDAFDAQIGAGLRVAHGELSKT